jgi:hypothetical protein
MATWTARSFGAALLVLLAVAGAAHCLLSQLHHNKQAKKGSSSILGELKQPQVSKRERRAARVASRRARKDARLQAAKAVQSQGLERERRGKSCEQLQEEVERVKMRRVEQYVGCCSYRLVQ